MDEYREHVKRVQEALDQDAAFIQPDPYLAQRVLNQARREGEKTVKKKISVALIIAIALMLSGAVAVAAALLWQDYVPQVKQAEHELGDYVEWPADQRIKLANDLLSMGYVNESEAAAVLVSEDATEEEKALAADQMMLELTGLDDVKEIHSSFITYAIMGYEDTWTPEQRVWWNGIVTMYGDDGATDTLIVPTDNDLPEEEAVAIAKAAVKEAYGFDDAYMAKLHPVANLYVTDERPDYKRWDIQLKLYREGSTSWAEKIYCVIVDENGEVIEDPDIGAPHIAEQAARTKALEEKKKAPYLQLYLKYFEEQGSNFFWCWPYDVKAAYSEEIIPLTNNLESLSEEVAKTIVYRYGIPSEDNIQYDQALQLTKRTVCDQYGLTSDEIEQYSTMYEAFDITDQSAPKWKFVLINPDDWYGIRYRVHVDAITGEVILHEQLMWQRFLKDEEYDMKYY